MLRNSLYVATLAAAGVSAHGYIERIDIGGDSYVGYNPTIYPWVPVQDSIGWANRAEDLGFVKPSELSSPHIICQRDGSNAPKTATVAAGSEISLQWSPWPDSHHGPIMDYLANCNGDCTTVDKTELKFFKIAEVGQLELGSGAGTPGYWAADKLLEDSNVWTVKIPSKLAPGNYVLRHEILALHSAYSVGGAQFYPQCINLVVTGNGTASPEGVAATSLYTDSDPGVHYNIYNDESSPSYQIPGPAVVSI